MTSSEVVLAVAAALFLWRNYWTMHERFGFTRRARLMLWHEAAHAECDAVIHAASSSDEMESHVEGS